MWILKGNLFFCWIFDLALHHSISNIVIFCSINLEKWCEISIQMNSLFRLSCESFQKSVFLSFIFMWFLTHTLLCSTPKEFYFCRVWTDLDFIYIWRLFFHIFFFCYQLKFMHENFLVLAEYKISFCDWEKLNMMMKGIWRFDWSKAFVNLFYLWLIFNVIWYLYSCFSLKIFSFFHIFDVDFSIDEGGLSLLTDFSNIIHLSTYISVGNTISQ